MLHAYTYGAPSHGRKELALREASFGVRSPSTQCEAGETFRIDGFRKAVLIPPWPIRAPFYYGHCGPKAAYLRVRASSVRKGEAAKERVACYAPVRAHLGRLQLASLAHPA